MRSRVPKRVSVEETKGTEAFPGGAVIKGQFPWSALLVWIWLAWIWFIGIAGFFLANSWRKWPDPLIDFGRELYLPWRIAHGAVLYRDVDDFYGPLSQYFNAALFKCFGPGMLVLVAANLAVFAAITVLVYFLFRRAWGAAAAAICVSIFIAVFGFGQYVAIGNYNYATPYAHESTHGLLVCLLLVLALCRWVESRAIGWSFLAGGLFGLTLVLKSEFIAAGALMTLAAVVVRWRHQKPVPWSAVGAWAASAVAPTLGFAAYFSVYMPSKEALAFACHAWSNAVWVFAWGGPLQIGFLGLDQPWENLRELAGATAVAILLIGGIGGGAWLAGRCVHLWHRLALSGLLAGLLLWLSWSVISWGGVGRCLLGLTCLYASIRTASILRNEVGLDVSTLKLLITLLAVTLMARMLLNGRIYQYGFYQAALAGLLIPAIMVGDLPVWLRLDRWGKMTVVAASMALLTPGVVLLSNQSHRILGLKNYAVGRGSDLFYSFPPNVEPTGDIVRVVSDWLLKLPPGQTLAVLPEGEMINYLARMPSPVAPFCFYSGAASASDEDAMVKDLSRHPPDWIVVVSRDLREYGIRRYGEAPGKGRQVLGWVTDNYRVAMSLGGDPLDPRQRGAIILRHEGNARVKP